MRAWRLLDRAVTALAARRRAPGSWRQRCAPQATRAPRHRAWLVRPWPRHAGISQRRWPRPPRPPRLPSRNDRGGAAGDGRTCPPSAPPDLWSAFQRPRSHPPCPPTHCSSPPSAPLALPSPLPQLPLLCHCRLSSVNNTPTGPSPQPAWPRRPPRCRPLPSTVRRPADSGSHSTATPRARPSRHDPPAARPSNAPVPRLQPTLSPPSAHGRGGQRGRPW